ncbi:MAG TPA: redoxin domain-containing protein [Puia sp.]|nr:redoxin domain-containing protein [Puia sp.]
MKAICRNTGIVISLVVLCLTSKEQPALNMSLLHNARLWNASTEKSESLKLFQDNKKLLVFVFISPECPLCKNYSLVLNELQKQYAGSVRLTGIVPGKSYSSAEVKEYMRKYKIDFDIYIDSARSISGLLQAKVTPEVFLIVPNGFIVYHGAIDNWIKQLGTTSGKTTEFYLSDAIDRSLASKPVNLHFKKPVGCLINDY